MKLVLSFILLLGTAAADAATLPGFRVERLAATAGFPSSVAIDSQGRVFYTTTDGFLHRWTATGSEPITAVPTGGTGNSGLLGMALLDDQTAVVHYTSPARTHDVVSMIDLATGAESVLHAFVGDIDFPARGTPDEHHGGNPHVASDGSVFVGIGDYGWNFIARDPAWNGGKIFRITRDGTATQFARGLRNPFDMAWDAESGRLIVADNGPIGGDEIHIIEEGSDLGWPHTYGTLPPVAGTVVPDYVFPETTAPTGMLLLNDGVPLMSRGFLVGAFVTRSIYYFHDASARPLAEPLVLVERETPPIIDLAQAPDGTILFVAGGFSPGASGIYRLVPPRRGDCNGDGRLSSADRSALEAELREGTLQRTVDVHNGTHAGSWGCDADADGFVTAADAVALDRLVIGRRRGVAK